jgi:hypothetical protein
LFVGNQEQILKLVEQLEKIAEMPNGTTGKLGKLNFCVSTEITIKFGDTDYVEMPSDAWLIMACKFREVVFQYEENPFYFNEVGYIYPPLPYDVGVEVAE